MAETGIYRQAKLWQPLPRLSANTGRTSALALSLFLAACQGSGPRVIPAPPQPPTTQTGPINALPTDVQRHRIALLVPTTGSNAGVGQSLVNATTLALMDANAENLRITTYDTSKGAAAAASKAISDGNRLILGPLVADDVRIVAPIARAANVPIISFSNDNSVAGSGVFLMGYTPNQSVSRVVSFARSKGVTRYAALVPKGVYGERAGNAMLRAVEQVGGTVVSMQSFDRSPAGMTMAVRKLSTGNTPYEAVLIADGGKTAVNFAPIIRKNGGANARLLGTELWNTESSLMASPALRGAWFASVSDTYYRQLSSKYRTRFGISPYRIASLGYDAVLLTIRVAKDWKTGTAFPLARLTNDGGFAGIDGAFRFRSDGIAERALEVQQVDAGKFTVIDAAPSGFGR
jgi:branched-chain amino acid transport system substrate-binding protein